MWRSSGNRRRSVACRAGCRDAGAIIVSLAGATLLAASCAEPPDIQGPTALPEDGPGSLASDGEAAGEAQQEIQLLKVIRCKGDEVGSSCERKCDAEGVWCPSRLAHPTNRDADVGLLYQCRGALVGRTCWYYYDDIQEKCVRATVAGKSKTLCWEDSERP